MSDEHNAGVLGCYGNKIIRTPSLDRLAARGVAFDSAYTNSPLCVPCRLSFTSGKYISRVGAWNNECWLPGDDSSILNHDRRVTAGTVDFLTHRKPTDKPFFLFVGYLATHFPLIVSWPERWPVGQRREGVCSLVDVVQTVAELGHAKVPADWNGSSLCRVLDNPKAPWKDMAVSEYYAHHIASGYVMFRKGPFKYVYHTPPDVKHPAERELCDLRNDPGEFHNLAADPGQKQRIEQMHAALVKELGEDPDKTELRCRADYAKGYGRAEIPRTRNKKARADE
jgi:arylsulfatase A-like enzyme